MKSLFRALWYRPGVFFPICIFSGLILWVSVSIPLRVAIALSIGILVTWFVEWYRDLVTTLEDIDFSDEMAPLFIEKKRDQEAVIKGFNATAAQLISPDEHMYCVCGPTSGSGKSTMAAAIVSHLQEQNGNAILINADSLRVIPTDYEPMFSKHTKPARIIGPIKKSDAAAMVQTIIETEACPVVIDHGPLGIEELQEACSAKTTVLVVGSRQVSCRELSAFWREIRTYSNRAILVLNSGAKGAQPYAYYLWNPPK